MTAEIRQLETTPGPGRMATPQLRTVVVCDIADSTALVERLGDQNAANIIRKHDRLARALVEQHRGHEIDKTDGFLLLFERPIQAAAFALDYQRSLKHLSAAEGVVVRARVGIHMGDVVIWENAPEDVARGAKPIEVEGLVKPIAARLAQLAKPQQILMSSAAAGIAHRAEGELGAEAVPRVHWKTHGKYTFKGLPGALEVIEVGEEGVAPMHAPKSVRTARRVLPWWRRPLTLATEAAVLAIGIGVGVWLLLQSPPTLAFAARDWVVVGNLHNLTGDALFDQSVDSALRISLEQSQYVNVLPELSVRQTLKRMELNPDKTDVNRAVGSQIALRDGARALILPTVADIGGRMSVTAEVIDPNTQATVYSISADGVGKQSVLPSLDSVSKQLRGKLGEALAMVSKQSMPLAKVATPNLHALRAYSLGERAYNSVDLEQAEVLFDQALKIDPHFALAHVELAKIFASRNESAKMLEQIHAAQTDRARLSPREELYVDAWAENSLAPRQALAKWKLLASVYPDYFAGLGTYAFCLWNDSNDFVNAATYFKQAASGKNPHRGIDLYMLGAMYAEAGRYVDAVRAFSAAVADGLHSPLTNYASVYAAQREFAQASRVLKQSGVTSTNLADVGMRLAMELDQGRWRTAEEMLATAQTQANSESQRVAEGYALVRLGLQALDGTSDKAQVSALADYLGRMRGALDHVNLAERGDFEFRIAMVGYFAARAGDVSLARRALTLIDAKPGDTWLLANMRGVAAAETELAAGRARDAIMALKAQVKGNELYVTHVALMDAYASVGDYAQALTEARWVAAQRGRAYFENSVSQYLTPFNVTESNLALLSQAQFSLASGDKAGAHTALETFARVWPGMTNKGFVAMRYQKLARQL